MQHRWPLHADDGLVLHVSMLKFGSGSSISSQTDSRNVHQAHLTPWQLPLLLLMHMRSLMCSTASEHFTSSSSCTSAAAAGAGATMVSCATPDIWWQRESSGGNNSTSISSSNNSW
ncbi:unnamed protein product [Pylaiella littoralis]